VPPARTPRVRPPGLQPARGKKNTCTRRLLNAVRAERSGCLPLWLHAYPASVLAGIGRQADA